MTGQKALSPLLAALAIQMLAISLAGAQPVADFYQGKTLTLFIGADSGGGYDLFARTLSRHLAAHVPGGPAIVPSNMPGAGSMVLGNYLAKVAPRDGTAIGAVSSLLLFEPLFRGPQSMAQFRGPDMTMIGNAALAHWVFITRHAAEVSSMADLRHKDLIVGTTTPASDAYILTHAVKQILGLDRLKIVTGYRGIRDVAGALERGEISGCVMDLEDIMAVYPQWLANETVDVIARFSPRQMTEGQTKAPPISDFVADDTDRAALEAIMSSTMLARPLIAPPGLPPAQTKALRDGYLATLDDRDFLDEASKLKLSLNPTSGERMQKIVNDAYALPPSLLARIRAVLAD